jgi:ammonia channel protein AmtB
LFGHIFSRLQFLLFFIHSIIFVRYFAVLFRSILSPPPSVTLIHNLLILFLPFFIHFSFLSFLPSFSISGFDDALDAFGVHAIGGIIGGLATGFFATDQVATPFSYGGKRKEE